MQVIDHTRSGETLVIGLMLRRCEIILLLFIYHVCKHSTVWKILLYLVHDAVICWYFFSQRQISSIVLCQVIQEVPGSSGKWRCLKVGVWSGNPFVLCKFWLISPFSRHSLNEFVKPASSKGMSIDDIHLSSDDLEMYIDLAPFLNPSPYIVPEDMSLTKVCNFISVFIPSCLLCLMWIYSLP